VEERLGFRGFDRFSTILIIWLNTGHRFFELEIVPFCRAFQALSNGVVFKVFGRFFLSDGRGCDFCCLYQAAINHTIYLFYNVLIRASIFYVEIISVIFWVVLCIFFDIFEEKKKWADLRAYTPPSFRLYVESYTKCIDITISFGLDKILKKIYWSQKMKKSIFPAILGVVQKVILTQSPILTKRFKKTLVIKTCSLFQYETQYIFERAFSKNQ